MRMSEQNFPEHTVEKIGGTSMSRLTELRDTLLIGDRKGADHRWPHLCCLGLWRYHQPLARA